MSTITCPVCWGSRKDIIVPSQPCVKCGGNGYITVNDETGGQRRRGKPTTRDIITLLILVGAVIGLIAYIFSQ